LKEKEKKQKNKTKKTKREKRIKTLAIWRDLRLGSIVFRFLFSFFLTFVSFFSFLLFFFFLFLFFLLLSSHRQTTTALNPITYTHLYHGEWFDGRLVDPGWDKPGANTSAWTPAVAATFVNTDGGPTVDAAHALGQLSLHALPPIAITSSIVKKSINQ
jgi:hypothetical protein